MKRQYHLSRCVIVGCLSLMLGLAACNTITTQLAPDHMKLSIDIKDYHVGTTHVGMHFTDANNNTVEFVHGETVKCNGVFLAYDSGFFAHAFGYGAYSGEVPLQPAGGTYIFTYTSASGVAQTIAVGVVNAPVTITQPTSGGTAALPANNQPFIVHYMTSGLPNTSAYGTVSDSRVHVAIAFTLDESGALSFKASDMQPFQPGTGNVAVARITNSTPTGTAFIATSVSYENITTIPITWR